MEKKNKTHQEDNPKGKTSDLERHPSQGTGFTEDSNSLEEKEETQALLQDEDPAVTLSTTEYVKEIPLLGSNKENQPESHIDKNSPNYCETDSYIFKKEQPDLINNVLSNADTITKQNCSDNEDLTEKSGVTSTTKSSKNNSNCVGNNKTKCEVGEKMPRNGFSLSDDASEAPAERYKESVQLKKIDGHGIEDIPDEDDEIYTQLIVKPKQKRVSVLQLFRFADSLDYVLMFFGFVFAVLHGTAIQVNYIILSDVTDIFIDSVLTDCNETISNCTDGMEELLDEIPRIVIEFSLNATGVFVFGYIHMSLWVYTADRQIRVIRRRAFHNILRQHTGYFDKNKSGALVTTLTEDISTFQAGIGDKVATFIQWVSTFIVGAIICLVRGWQLTLVILTVAPVAAIAGAIVARVLQKVARKELIAFSKAGSVAEEVLSAIRIVAAYSGEDKECERYASCLKVARKVGITKGLVSGVGQGMVWVIAFGIIGLAFWYGGELYRDETVTAGFVLQVQFAMFVGMRSLGWSVGSLEAISSARGAAAGVYDIIDAEPEIDSASRKGVTPVKCAGEVKFEGVEFVYPTRTDVPVLTGLNLTIEKGKTAALVGPSGCGKSTTIQLLQRYYDPIKGGVKLDGTDVRKLNIHWLRNQIGVVSQEPILFATTIEENIRFGYNDATLEEIISSAKEASAHHFIMKLPRQYQTVLSELGTSLSRGEKQRISLARALIRKPKILLLDEATSALDNEAEAIVQAALDKASKGRTTIVIAHRLSTVRNADKLFVIDKGVVAESGSHDELMAKQGLYSQLVSRQMQAGTKERETEQKKKQKAIEAGEIVVTVDDTITDPAFVGKVRSFSISSVGSKISKMKDLEDEEELLDDFPPPAMSRIYRLNAPELPIMVIGGICAMLQGAIFPSLAVLFSEVLGCFAIEDVQEQKDEINFYVAIIAGTGLFAGLFTLLMVYLFTISGEKLTFRIRCLAFRTMLRQEIGWFDEKENQVGTLTSRLANDASRMKGATGTALCTVINATSTAVTSLIIGFVFGWKLALVVAAFLPLLVLVGVLQTQMMTGYAKGGQKAVEDGGKICAEAIDKVRTIAALTKEEYFEEKYNNHFDILFQGAKKKANMYGITWGASQCLLYFSFAAAFGFGGYLVGIGEMDFKNVFRVFIAICAGGVEIGRVNAFAPDYSKAKVAAAKLFALFDRESKIDPFDETGAKPDRCNAEIHFKDVVFSYPTRPETNVLKGFNLDIFPGQFVALVGPSGNGKTTAIQLLERFYDLANMGSLTLDGNAVHNLNIQWLRSKIAIVTQDPILFGTSIRENIEYGDNFRRVTMDEVIQAAKSANIHNFITTLPQGYETNVGMKGTQLSGGQKQRVSIARALVRNPKILILDDATSALDSESEGVVQEALEKAQAGRTSLVIAHRLSSVVDAHQIGYVENGVIVEKGKHAVLMEQKGYYWKLQQKYLGNKEHEG